MLFRSDNRENSSFEEPNSAFLLSALVFSLLSHLSNPHYTTAPSFECLTVTSLLNFSRGLAVTVSRRLLELFGTASNGVPFSISPYRTPFLNARGEVIYFLFLFELILIALLGIVYSNKVFFFPIEEFSWIACSLLFIYK